MGGAEFVTLGVTGKLVPFDPDADQIGETVTRILQAIQETKL